MNTTEQELVPVVIDLGAKRKGSLDESALTALGAQLGDALRQIMVGAQPFMSIKGTPREIEALMTMTGNSKSQAPEFQTPKMVRTMTPKLNQNQILKNLMNQSHTTVKDSVYILMVMKTRSCL